MAFKELNENELSLLSEREQEIYKIRYEEYLERVRLVEKLEKFRKIPRKHIRPENTPLKDIPFPKYRNVNFRLFTLRMNSARLNSLFAVTRQDNKVSSVKIDNAKVNMPVCKKIDEFFSKLNTDNKIVSSMPKVSHIEVPSVVQPKVSYIKKIQEVDIECLNTVCIPDSKKYSYSKKAHHISPLEDVVIPKTVYSERQNEKYKASAGKVKIAAATRIKMSMSPYRLKNIPKTIVRNADDCHISPVKNFKAELKQCKVVNTTDLYLKLKSYTVKDMQKVCVPKSKQYENQDTIVRPAVKYHVNIPSPLVKDHTNIKFKVKGLVSVKMVGQDVGNNIVIEKFGDISLGSVPFATASMIKYHSDDISLKYIKPCICAKAQVQEIDCDKNVSLTELPNIKIPKSDVKTDMLSLKFSAENKQVTVSKIVYFDYDKTLNRILDLLRRDYEKR